LQKESLWVAWIFNRIKKFITEKKDLNFKTQNDCHSPEGDSAGAWLEGEK